MTTRGPRQDVRRKEVVRWKRVSASGSTDSTGFSVATDELDIDKTVLAKVREQFEPFAREAGASFNARRGIECRVPLSAPRTGFRVGDVIEYRDEDYNVIGTANIRGEVLVSAELGATRA